MIKSGIKLEDSLFTDDLRLVFYEKQGEEIYILPVTIKSPAEKKDREFLEKFLGQHEIETKVVRSS